MFEHQPKDTVSSHTPNAWAERSYDAAQWTNWSFATKTMLGSYLARRPDFIFSTSFHRFMYVMTKWSLNEFKYLFHSTIKQKQQDVAGVASMSPTLWNNWTVMMNGSFEKDLCFSAIRLISYLIVSFLRIIPMLWLNRVEDSELVRHTSSGRGSDSDGSGPLVSHWSERITRSYYTYFMTMLSFDTNAALRLTYVALRVLIGYICYARIKAKETREFTPRRYALRMFQWQTGIHKLRMNLRELTDKFRNKSSELWRRSLKRIVCRWRSVLKSEYSDTNSTVVAEGEKRRSKPTFFQKLLCQVFVIPARAPKIQTSMVIKLFF